MPPTHYFPEKQKQQAKALIFSIKSASCSTFVLKDILIYTDIMFHEGPSKGYSTFVRV